MMPVPRSSIRGHLLTAIAAVLLLLPFLPTSGIPAEPFALLALLVGTPIVLRGPVRGGITAALLLLVALRLADAGMQAAFARPFNPMFDAPLVAAGWDLAERSVGRPLALLAAGLLAAGFAGLAVLFWWATGRLSAVRRPRLSIGLCALLLVPAFAGSPLPADATRLVVRHVADARAARADLARFRAESANDPWAEAAPAAILPALADHDVLLVFVESYGRTALDNPRYASVIRPVLTQGEAEIPAAGLAARSAFLASPVSGGQSWLPRSSFVSGLTIDSEARYRALLASPRRTLLHLAHNAGWTTAAVVPAITLAWPEGGFFGYDRILAAADLGYRGAPFNWITMPDQFTLAAVERQLLASGPNPDPSTRPRIFAEIALISSHAPWTPIPPLLPWDTLGDGTVFTPFANAGDSPDVLWRDPERVRAQYAGSISYSLRTVLEFAMRNGPRGALVIVLGDHQPAGFVAEGFGGTAVPIHVIGPPELVAALDGPEWTPGLLPAGGGPVLPMAAFRDRFLAAFGDRTASYASTNPLPSPRGP